MRVNELPQTSQAQTRQGVCVLIAAPAALQSTGLCLQSVRAHTPADIEVLVVEPTADSVNEAIERTQRADVIVIDSPCKVAPDWLECLRVSAYADTNTATASALADFGTALAISDRQLDGAAFAERAAAVAAGQSRPHPRLRRAVGPCIYVRREALELVGSLDEELPLDLALELDFTQRCLLSGLAHVAAEHVLVESLEAAPGSEASEPLASLLERYPHLAGDSALAESGVLGDVLRAVPGATAVDRLWVTIDARALDGAVTGTQVHIVELIRALAHTEALRLRVLVRTRRIDPETLALLRELPETELLAEEQITPSTPRSAVFHRPQQAFAAEDVALAVALGERIVLSQLDLIAYRNPGYFPDVASWEDYRRASRHGLAAAERVVVFSEHTSRELQGDALVEESRIRVVPPGLDHRMAVGEQRPRALEDAPADALTGDFLLCLGTDFRHKNRLFALRLLAALRSEFGWSGKLVLAGTHIPHGSSLELERAYREEHPEVSEAVLTLGPIDEQEKAWLLARASAVLYPSAYEGFGLVPFESALAGVPCLFAPRSSLAEAAPGSTATIVPWDPVASAAAAHPLLSDGEAHTNHVGALAEAASALTWSRAAGQLVEIYREAASAPTREAAVLSRDAVQRERRLTEAHQAVNRRLIGEREHAQRMYDELNAEVGSGLSLIGPNGSLPDEAQRALLSVSAHPAVSRPLFGALSRVFLAGRAFGRIVPRRRRRER
jgi:glycosyltransferase involved in cell wall biosynthesis